MPSCYKIFEHWADKCISPDGKVGVIGEINGRRVVENEHLAQCWACGHAVKRRDVLSWDKYDIDPHEVWADKRINSTLQKCHILAKQFGGPNEPDNLFLLCSDCHAESPDTRNRDAFFRWVYRKKRDCSNGLDCKEFVANTTEEIESRGYNLEEFAKKFCKLPLKKQWEVIESGLYNCGTHGATVAPSSAAICIIDEIERYISSEAKVG